jgi:hypothetical protein
MSAFHPNLPSGFDPFRTLRYLPAEPGHGTLEDHGAIFVQ